jgi:hypothetical protein
MNMAEYNRDKVLTRIAGSLFILVGIVAGGLAWWSVKSDYTLRNDKWLCVTGVIERAEIDWGTTHGLDGIWVDCSYAYELPEWQLHNDRVSIGFPSHDEFMSLIKRIGRDDRKVRGKTIPVWIKEEDPSVSVLINPQQRTYWRSACICVFALLMIGGGIFCWIISTCHAS